jgi:hypothetical protein
MINNQQWGMNAPTGTLLHISGIITFDSKNKIRSNGITIMAFLTVTSNTENHNFAFCGDHLKTVQNPGNVVLIGIWWKA